LSVSSLLPKSLKNSLQNLPKLALRLRLIRGITPLIRNRNWIDILPSANLYANVYHNAQTKFMHFILDRHHWDILVLRSLSYANAESVLLGA
jgi:hypothetical protein